MISATAYRISREGMLPVCIAPFGVDELEPHLPIDPATIPHESVGAHERYTTKTAAEIIAARSVSEVSTWWGVYRGDPSVAAFIGMIGLRPAEDATALPVHEIGTVIIPGSARGQGSAKLASLGAMHYGQNELGVPAFRAGVASRNYGAQTVLHRIGYVHMATQPIARDSSEAYVDGSAQQEWCWASPDGVARGAAGMSHILAGKLREGWDRHQAYMRQVTIDLL